MRAIIMCLFLFASVSGISQEVYHNFFDGQVYVKLDPSLLTGLKNEDHRKIAPSKFAFLEKIEQKYGITNVRRPFIQAGDDPVLPNIIKIEFNKIAHVEKLISELSELPGIAYAEKVPLALTTATPSEGIPPHLAQINAAGAWDVFNGNSNITVAIVDNAVMWTHADLVQNTYTNTAEIPNNNIDDDNNGYVDDVNGFDVSDWDNNTIPSFTGMDHGTHCAGIAAGRTDNSTGIASIGWNVKFIPVKCQTNNGSPGIVANGFEGIVYAAKAKARIISCSFGNSGSSITEQSVIDYAWNRGCIIFASAGNVSSSTPNYPGAYNNVYCVAAVEPNDVKWSLSAFGSWVDIAAPGTNINSTVPYTGSPAYNTASGTSMATPLVAGLAALMLSRSPQMTRTDVLNCISSTAVNISTLSGNTGFALGAGRINAFAAMNCAASYSAVPPVANFYTNHRQPCPGTPVQFIDSSLYSPSTWSWVFQGGTPATSTNSLPLVQWSSPGTYSVMLTVSNGNGSNAITKLSYITVSGPQNLPFVEGFEQAGFLPAGWNPINLWNDNIYWARRTNLGAWGTSTACAMFDNYTYNAANERDEMWSPKFSFTNVALARLRFDVAYARYDAIYCDSLEVKLSTNCGQSWSSIYLKGNTTLATAPDAAAQFIPSSTQWRRDTIDISSLAAGQGNVMFSFINRGHYGQVIYLDNINIATPFPTISVNNSATVCVNSPVSFTNNSIGAFSYTYYFQGASQSSASIANPTVSYSSPGTYTLAISALNGTATSVMIKTITVLPYPVISVANVTTCAGNNITLTATGATGYTWTNGASVTNGALLAVNPGVSTVYTVTGSNGFCSSLTTASVTVTSSTVVLNAAASSPTLCSGSSITLTATGADQIFWQGGPTGTITTISPLVSGNYSVQGITAGCGASASVNYTVIPTPTIVLSTKDVSCFGNCSGSFTAITTGQGPFSYSVNSACNQSVCTNLCAGNYTMTSKDNFGCSAELPFFIAEPPLLSSMLSSSMHVSCSACGDGSAVISTTGGTGPYSYSWTPNVSNSESASGLSADCYSVIISDANFCTEQIDFCLFFAMGIETSAGYKDILVYPNPASDRVCFRNVPNPLSVKLYNAAGQLVAEKIVAQENDTIEMSGLARGLYFVTYFSDKASGALRLVLE